MRTPVWTGLVLIAVVANLAAQRGALGGEWRSHSGDRGSTKYAALDQIGKDNVSQLRIAWRRPAVDPALVAGAGTFTRAGSTAGRRQAMRSCETLSLPI